MATLAFDAANRLTLEQDNFSKYVLTYDNADRLTNVDNNGTPNAPHVLLTYGYDQFNNRTSIADNSGASLALAFDSDNNLISESMSKPGVLGLNHPTVTLAYDSANRLTNLSRTVVNKFGNSATITTTYGYDSADRLTGITHYVVGGSTLMTLTYGYDSANQLTSYAGPDGSITYGYDNDGQLTGATGAHNETYSYDKEGNRTISGYVTSIGNRLTSDGTYSYTYDQDGNMLTQTRISDSQLTSYTWDFRNRLTEVLIKTSGGTTVQDDKFTYDIENRRIGKSTLSGGQGWTAYVDANPYADFNSSGSLTYWHLYGVGIDSLLGRVDSSGNAMWYLMDKLGSVRENVDVSGNVLDSITYDTYGNILAENHPTSGDRFKFTRREWDSEIGQYFYQARYYSPSNGRFESEDPSGFLAGDTDLYRYVHNDPTGLIDPTGLEAIPDKVTMQSAGPVGGKWDPAAGLVIKKWRRLGFADWVGFFSWGWYYKVTISDAAGVPLQSFKAAERVKVIGEPKGYFKDVPFILNTTTEPRVWRFDRAAVPQAGGQNTEKSKEIAAIVLQGEISGSGGWGEVVLQQYFVDSNKKVIKHSGFKITHVVRQLGKGPFVVSTKKEPMGWKEEAYFIKPQLNVDPGEADGVFHDDQIW